MFEKWSYILKAFSALLAIWGLKTLLKGFEKNLRSIPGPWPSRFTRLPLKIAIITGNRAFYIHKLHQKYGPVVRIAPNEVALASGEAWREIHRIGTRFRKDAKWYQTQSPNQYDDDTCGIFGVISHKKASQRRRLYQQVATKGQVQTWSVVNPFPSHVNMPSYRGAIIQSPLESKFDPIIENVMKKIDRELKVNGIADVHKWWSFLTTDVIGEVAFGQSFGMVESERVPQLIEDINSAMMFAGMRQEARLIFELLRLHPDQGKRPLELLDRLESASERAVQNSKQLTKNGGQTIFSKMYPEDDAPLFSDSLMQSEAMNLIIAGSDTTASALINLTYEVLRNPEIKSRLLEELATLPASITWTDLEKLKYLNCTIEEVLRVYPPILSALPRVCLDGPAIIDSYCIPAGTTCATQAWTLHRDPIAFPNPEKFDPSRWISPSKAMREHWGAFGGANRSCIGQNIARMEILYAAAKFFIKFPDVELAETVTPDSMTLVDYFVLKRKGNKLEIRLS